MNIESRRCSNEINQVDYIFSYLISQYTINSNLNVIETVEWLPSVYANKIGHTIDIYKLFSGLETNIKILLGYTIYKPKDGYRIIPVYSTASPYVVIGSMWVASDGRVLIYKPSETTDLYVSGQYIFK